MKEEKADKGISKNANLGEEEILFIREFIKAEGSNLKEIIYNRGNIRYMQVARRFSTPVLWKKAKEYFEKIENGEVSSEDLADYEEIITLLLIVIVMKEDIKGDNDNSAQSKNVHELKDDGR